MLAKLAENHNHWVKMAAHICGNTEMAEDYVQDMYLKLHNSTKEINANYVYVTIRSIFIDSKRKNKEIFLEVQSDFPASEEINYDDVFVSEKEYQAAIDVFKGLKFYEREIVRFSYLEGQREFSRNSGISMGVIQRVIKKYKDQVCQHLKKNHVNQGRKLKDLGTSLNQPQAQSESLLVMDVNQEKIFLTSCFLSTE